MAIDDEGPRKKTAVELGCDLTVLSIEELRDYLTTLDAETARVKAQIDAKLSSRHAADAVFKR
jgi:uncharacterized small protein (DUF1192 family)